MKRIIYNLTLCLLLLGFVSCEDETTQDNSKITYHAEITLEGESSMFWDLGKTWEEPGYSAVMAGKDVTDKVEISTDLDVTKGGVYTVNYVVTNEDGLSRSETRTVYVADPTPSLIQSGVWTVKATSYRDATAVGGVLSEYGDSYNVLILQVSPGKFYMSDMLGGWYEQRAGYGSSCAMVGHILVDEADIILGAGDAFVAEWGDSYTSLMGFVTQDGIELTVDYAEMIFNMTLTYNN